jgi:hypothetical protein
MLYWDQARSRLQMCALSRGDCKDSSSVKRGGKTAATKCIRRLKIEARPTTEQLSEKIALLESSSNAKKI